MCIACNRTGIINTRASGAMNSISHSKPPHYASYILGHDGASSFRFSVVMALSSRLCERPGYVVNVDTI